MIRLATLEDLSIIKDIYAHARSFMALTGNPNQWINNYPSIDGTFIRTKRNKNKEKTI